MKKDEDRPSVESPYEPLPDEHHLSAKSFFAAQERSNQARAELGLD